MIASQASLEFVDSAATPLPLGALVELLVDTVHGGASVGFLAPLPAAEALGYWQQVQRELGPARWLWLAWQGARLQGAVQLALCDKPNGRHRAEVQKLLVHRRARGQRLASLLMTALERQTVAAGRTLLVLDTLAGSDAERVYRHLGWSAAGQIPAYAAAPDGVLHATVLYYKALPPAPPPGSETGPGGHAPS